VGIPDELALEGTLKELLMNTVYRTNLIIMMVTWSYASFAFFVVPFYLATVDGNYYLMNLMTAIAEIVASIILLFFTANQDKKRLLILFCFVSFCGCTGVLVFDAFYEGKSQIPDAVLYLLLYTGITAAFDLVYLVVCDLFPTIFRGTAYGACNVLGRFISILSPEIARLKGYWPMGILAAFSLVATILPMGLKRAKKD
jgi:Na+/melibiose symporter-like transporter